jgi:hypothetical protein
LGNIIFAHGHHKPLDTTQGKSEGMETLYQKAQQHPESSMILQKAQTGQALGSETAWGNICKYWDVKTQVWTAPTMYHRCSLQESAKQYNSENTHPCDSGTMPLAVQRKAAGDSGAKLLVV